MKKIIAIVAIIASAQASAFWGDNNSGNGTHNGAMDAAGNGTGEGEATFSMSFSGKGKSAGDFKGNGNTAANLDSATTDSAPYYYSAPVAPVK